MFRSRNPFSMSQFLNRSLERRPKLTLRPEYSKPFNAPTTVNFIRVPLEEYNDTIFKAMWEIKKGLQYVFQTKNPTTLCVGFCHNEIEAVLCNLIEDGETILVGIIGELGKKAAEIGKQYGAKVYVMKANAGEVLKVEKIKACLEKFQPKLFIIAHGDCSTGVLQPLEQLGTLCHNNNCLFVVDATNTLGAVDLQTDNWKIDVAFGAPQKALGTPMGVVPISVSSNALMKLAIRRTPVKTTIWDIKELSQAWHSFDESRCFYSELAPVQILYALRDNLLKIQNEGLQKVVVRHQYNSKRLQKGLVDTIGLELYVKEPKNRLPTVIVAKKPTGIDENHFMKSLSDRYSIRISAGIGITKGQVFRIGLMNENAKTNIVDEVLNAFYEVLNIMVPSYVDHCLNNIESIY